MDQRDAEVVAREFFGCMDHEVNSTSHGVRCMAYHGYGSPAHGCQSLTALLLRGRSEAFALCVRSLPCIAQDGHACACCLKAAATIRAAHLRTLPPSGGERAS